MGLIRECLAFGAAVAAFSGRRGLAAAFLVGLGAAFEGISILLLVPLLALVFGAAGVGTRLPLAGWLERFGPDLAPTARLALILGLFGLLMALRAVTLWRRDVLLGRLQVSFIESQRVKIARALANAGWRTLAAIGHGRITQLMGGDVQRCSAGAYFLLQGGVAMLILVVQVGLAFILSPALAAMAIGAMTVGTIALSGLLRRSRDVGKIVTEANLAFTEGMGRFLGGMKQAMSQNLQQAFVARFERDVGASAQRQTEFAGQQALLRGLWSLLAAGVAGATMLVGFAVLHLSAPVLIALLVVLARLSVPASQLHLGFQQIAYSLPAWRAVTELESELGAAASAASGMALAPVPPLAGSIEFERVVYRHRDEGGGGLAGVSLRIDVGEIVGLSGASGAGKTTFADLLVGLVEPQTGRIAIGGAPLTLATAVRWRGQIAYVAQDPVMFNDSLRANLTWANPGASEDDIAAMLAVVGAAGWVQGLPDGLETIVGQSGALISGGERQRVALARALLRRPALLVLDEATGALDLAAEDAIMARIRDLPHRPTIVMIAHRPESLRLCDRIVELADGIVVSDLPNERRHGPRASSGGSKLRQL